MTSRPPLGVQQRQPQRSLSGSGLPQRPTQHQRSLSQQYLPPSPIRKEAFFDFNSPDPGDAVQSRNGTFRRGGSRLKLELSNDSITHEGLSESPNALDTSRVVTPSRIMPNTDISDLGDMSPRPAVQSETGANESNRLPMPQRRKRFSLPVSRSQTKTNAPAAPPPKRDARPKAWSVEIPSSAPHYMTQTKGGSQSSTSAGTSSSKTSGNKAKGYADFFPWSGDHLEDQFSEHIIRQGFFDKAPITQTETASAKAAIFPLLKHKTGLHMLSQIFTGVLGQRRHSGQINTDSQFKVPPRVTVTDTKREGWLRDLANPEMSLRKLSRTIPHGIRGKVLLDQCVNKNIPADRATWLLKCVGAQELRTFKRKGANGAFVMGGEAKWIRDWTVCVEQFVEARFSALGESDWKTKVNYSIRLATHFYFEHLLDREHYMDWMISSLENSPQSKLPLWLLLTQIYWNDLLKLRRNGRRLVHVLLSHFLIIQNNPDKDILEPLSSRLTSLLLNVMSTRADNFVSPSIWSKYRGVLNSALPRDDNILRSTFESINSRNEQLVVNSIRSQPAARNTLVRLLDSSLQSPISNDFSKECWRIGKDKTALVKTLLEWCTSLYRPGLSKLYISTRLLISWSTFGVDTTTAVLDLLDTDPLTEPERKKLLYHLVSELVRSGHFSVSRYVQWLIARGGLSDPPDVAPEGPASTRLLVELPIHAMSESLRSLRANLLRRARYEVEYESKDTEMAIRYLKHTLGLPLDPNDAMLETKPLSIAKLSKRIRLSSRTLKTQVGTWLKDTFFDARESKDGKDVMDVPLETFVTVRTILEAASDFTMLAEVLKAVTKMSNPEVLGACADTVNLHISTMAGLGAGRELFDALLGRLKTVVDEQGIGARPLLAALASLATRIPDLEELSSQLHKDLVRSDRSSAVDACSPVSDNMAAHLQESEGELHEEIEKLLANGTSLDKNTMERLFGVVAGRLQGCWNKQDETQRAYSILLTRLRLFDPQHFDTIMTKWLQRVRVLAERPSILQIFPVLVSLDCLTIPVILSTTSDTAAGASGNTSTLPSLVQRTWRSRYVQEVLQLMTTPLLRHPLLTDEECYRFAIKQSQARKGHSNELLNLIRNSLAEYSICRQENGTELPLDSLETQSHIQELLQSLVLMDPMPVARALAVKNADAAVGTLIETTTTKLLLPNCAEGTQISFDQVLELTNELTLPFCQLKLSSSLALGDSSGPDANERMQSHLEMFVKAMDHAIDAKNITWTGMLSCLSPEITQHLKNRAQARFMDVLPSLKTPSTQGRTLEQSIQVAENLLSVMDAIIRGGTMGRPPQLVPSMVDKLADLWEVLSSGGDVTTKNAIVQHFLPGMLSFLTLHTATFDASKASNEVRAKALVVLAGILLDLNTLPTAVQADANLPGRVFDLAMVLVDNVAEDIRLQCVRMLREITSNERLRYLFSFTPPPNENFMLLHREKPTSGPGAAARPGQMGMGWGQQPEKLSKFTLKRWETISDPAPTVQENDSSLNMSLFEAIKL